MEQVTKYKSTIKSKPFFYKESKKTADLIVKGFSDAEIKNKSLNENIYQVNTESRKKEIASTVLNRLHMLDDYLLQKIVDGSMETSKILILISIMKTDRLFFDFMNEVFKEKIALKDYNLNDADINIYFQRKMEQSETVRSWDDYTFYKLKQVYSRILYEAGLIKDKKGNREIIKPIIENDIEEHLRNSDNEVYLKALLGEI